MNTYHKANLMFIYHIVRADHRSPSILKAIPTTIHHVNLEEVCLHNVLWDVIGREACSLLHIEYGTGSTGNGTGGIWGYGLRGSDCGKGFHDFSELD